MDETGSVHTCIGPAASGEYDIDIRAPFECPCRLAMSADESRLYVLDSRSSTIWSIDVTAREPRAIATTPFTPTSLALDEQVGVLYMTVPDSGQIYRLHIQTGELSVLATNTENERADDAHGQTAFVRPTGLALAPDRKRLYVADSGAHALRIVHLDTNVVTTLIDGRKHPQAPFGCTDVLVTPGGLMVVDATRHVLFGVNPRHGTVTPAIPPGAVVFLNPTTAAFDRTTRTCVVTDTGHHRIVRIARDMLSSDELQIHACSPTQPVS